MDRFAGFELSKELGSGSSATVYLASDPATLETVSLKVFHPAHSLDKRFQQRIQREYELVESLRHDNIVPVRSLVAQDSKPGIVMDYIDGENLEKFQSRLPYALPEVSCLIVIEILKALEYSHSRGVIHRDLKPANVLVSKAGRVFVTDFGLAKLQDAGTTFTQPQHILGSPDYMSPEQAIGEVIGERSDLFSVAGILYFLTTGTRPFSRPTALSTLQAIRESAPEKPERCNPKISAALSRIIQQGLSKGPALRFQSAKEFRDALEQYLSSLDLGAAQFRLSDWISDSSRGTLEALRTSVEALTRTADQAAREGRANLCLETLAHLSLKAPSSPVIEQMTQLLKRSRKSRWKAILLILLLVFGLSAFLFWKRAPAPIPPQGEVQFQVGKEVDVFWDGKRVDATRPLTQQSLGMHELMLVRKGYPPIQTKIEVTGDKPVVINAK